MEVIGNLRIEDGGRPTCWIFRQICKISPRDMGLSVSVCVSVFYNRSHNSHLSENQNVKNYISRLWHLPPNGVIAKIVLSDLDLCFQVQTFRMAILTRKHRKMQTRYQLGSQIFAIQWHQMLQMLQMLYIIT